MARWILLCALALFLAGCPYSKKIVPYSREALPTQAPVTQGLLASAASDALSQPVQDIGSLQGKKVCVELQSLSSPESGLLVEYMHGMVEAALAGVGALVVPCCRGRLIEGDASGAARTECYQDLDYRAVAAMPLGGIDVTQEREFAGGKFTGQLMVILGGTILTSASPACFASDAGFPCAISLWTLGPLALVSGLAWAIFDQPYEYRTQLDASVGIQIYLLPQRGDLRFIQGIGSGLKRLTIVDNRGDPHELR